MKKIILALAFSTLTLGGCMTYDPYTGEEKTSSATKGSIIGAIGGAAVGAATSSKSDRGKGALIGAASGGATRRDRRARHVVLRCPRVSVAPRSPYRLRQASSSVLVTSVRSSTSTASEFSNCTRTASTLRR